MKKYISFAFIFYLSSLPCFSQIEAENEQNDSIIVGTTKIDSLYREDQFYLGFTFNLLVNKPRGVDQSGFSGGMHLGFIRDMPINKKRTLAFGAGLGTSINSFGYDLLLTKDAQNTTEFQVIDEDINYDTNRHTIYLAEVPLQFRWRNSTPTSHKFWRIYAGVRLGYIYYFKANYKNSGEQIKLRDIPELNKWRTGLTFTFGYNTFNFHVYYSLNEFFDGTIKNSTESVGLNTIKVGFMFYIL